MNVKDTKVQDIKVEPPCVTNYHYEHLNHVPGCARLVPDHIFFGGKGERGIKLGNIFRKYQRKNYLHACTGGVGGLSQKRTRAYKED